MARRVLVVETGAELAPMVAAGAADVDPDIVIERARGVSSAVGRLAEGGYDLIVSADALDGARAGVFLRHLCERRHPAIPFLLLSLEAGGPGAVSVVECREQVKRLL